MILFMICFVIREIVEFCCRHHHWNCSNCRCTICFITHLLNCVDLYDRTAVSSSPSSSSSLYCSIVINIIYISRFSLIFLLFFAQTRKQIKLRCRPNKTEETMKIVNYTYIYIFYIICNFLIVNIRHTSK